MIDGVRPRWMITVIVFAVGYAYSILFGHVSSARVAAAALDPEHAQGLTPALRLPPAVGMVERVLYTTAILIGAPGFVVAWLAVKWATEQLRFEHRGRRI